MINQDNRIDAVKTRDAAGQNDRERVIGEKLKIIPLGGLERIGMNITAFEYGDSIVVVDCGMAFPEDDMLGIDFVLPDTTYLYSARLMCLFTRQSSPWL